VVSDLVRKRPIWFGGDDRSEASMARFYTWLGRNRGKTPGADALFACADASMSDSSYA
jgi:hypothetical protein